MIVTKKIEDGTVRIKADITDAGGRFYVYDTFDVRGKIVAKDRYTYVDDELPFSPLTVGEVGLVQNTVPTKKWLIEEIGLYLDSKGIDYTDEIKKADLLGLSEPQIEEEI